MIGQVRERIEALHEETRSKRAKAKQQENVISSFRSELSIAIAHVLNPRNSKVLLRH